MRAAWRRTVSLGWNSLLHARLASNPLLRIGLHPPDWNYPAIRAQALKFTRKALARRKAMTYEGWMETAAP